MVDKSEKFQWLVRLGYAARGLTYLLLGYMALGTRATPDEGNQAVFEMIQDVPLGEPLLYVMALGLAAYCIFKFASAIGDVQHRGSDKMGIAKRVGDAASGVAYAVLAWAAVEFAGAGRQNAESGQTAQATSTVLDWTLGDVLVGLVGLGFIAGGIMQAKKAATADFMHRMAGDTPQQVELVGRLGHAARAVVFAIVGWSLMQAAWFDSESQVKGIGEALMGLRQSGLGYTLVAIGLMLFGVFSLVAARYRIIPDFGAEGLKPKLR
ncbi:DUF1206 domain-containing protein [Erythrobacter arachoides]|uniref:DUF1206 domain-containing protein n=1 Tax=Aurantiacibacter arachoides TaxID=1850444 RepID=A0A845A100_9SPHN|nr:DUF1206 domain-containing protein [Aurantiacibacter arachoides]MXO93230.1 DUF1206 domain-containing protein [Aurantiacibacter arachoides]GGD50971.1 membrane protein [Aurantiacibacter arachoides]